MKKSFTLLITLFVLNIFSLILIFIMQTNSIQIKNLQNQYLYIQGKNHMNFLKSYMQSKNLKDIKTVKIEDEIFDIYANINQNKIFLFVKAKNYNITINETIPFGSK